MVYYDHAKAPGITTWRGVFRPVTVKRQCGWHGYKSMSANGADR